MSGHIQEGVLVWICHNMCVWCGETDASTCSSRHSECREVGYIIPGYLVPSLPVIMVHINH